jgi:hypothetical protein
MLSVVANKGASYWTTYQGCCSTNCLGHSESGTKYFRVGTDDWEDARWKRDKGTGKESCKVVRAAPAGGGYIAEATHRIRRRIRRRQPWS